MAAGCLKRDNKQCASYPVKTRPTPKNGVLGSKKKQLKESSSPNLPLWARRKGIRVERYNLTANYA